jgi:hypothetical protein
MFVPQGHFENSPAFQRRESDRIANESRRDGRHSGYSAMFFLPSLRDLTLMPIGPGIEMPGYCRWFLRNRTPAQKLNYARCSFQSQKMLENNFSQAYNALCETGKTEYEKR